MTTYVALFRAVNVGGRSVVAMAALRGLAEALGFGNPRTILQSGNLVFVAAATKTASLESALQAAAAERLGLETRIVVRSAVEWKRIIDANPFPNEAKTDPAHLLVMALERPANPNDVRGLQAAVRGREVVKGHGAELYLVYPDGIGRSKLTGSLIEKTIGARGTARNWNTVLKIAEAAQVR